MQNPDLGRSILFVDNDIDYRETISEFLTIAGYVVHGFSSYLEFADYIDALLLSGLDYGVIDGDQGVAVSDDIYDGFKTIQIIRERAELLSVHCPILIGSTSLGEIPGADYQHPPQGPSALISFLKSIPSSR